MKRKHYSYSTGRIVVPANGTNTGIVTIDADADFECCFMEGTTEQAGVLIANWAGTVLVHDSALSFDLSSVPIPFNNIAGTGQQPYPLNPAKRMLANSTFTVTWLDVSGVATTVCLTFSGNKLEPEQGDNNYRGGY